MTIPGRPIPSQSAEGRQAVVQDARGDLDEIHQVESLPRFQGAPEGGRDEDERKRDRQEEEGGLGFSVKCRRDVEDTVDEDGREDRRAARPRAHENQEDRSRPENTGGLFRFAVAQGRGDDPGGRHAEPEVQIAEVGEDDPGEGQEPEPLGPQRRTVHGMVTIPTTIGNPVRRGSGSCCGRGAGRPCDGGVSVFARRLRPGRGLVGYPFAP